MKVILLQGVSMVALLFGAALVPAAAAPARNGRRWRPSPTRPATRPRGSWRPSARARLPRRCPPASWRCACAPATRSRPGRCWSASTPGPPPTSFASARRRLPPPRRNSKLRATTTSAIAACSKSSTSAGLPWSRPRRSTRPRRRRPRQRRRRPASRRPRRRFRRWWPRTRASSRRSAPRSATWRRRACAIPIVYDPAELRVVAQLPESYAQ